MSEAREKARLAAAALEEKKASDLKIIDIEEISIIADYFIIASGSNRNQLHAMADAVEEKLGGAGFAPKNIEGYLNGNWILMDYGDIVLHLFDEENRVFYDLERIWRDGKQVEPESLLSE